MKITKDLVTFLTPHFTACLTFVVTEGKQCQPYAKNMNSFFTVEIHQADDKNVSENTK